MADYKPSSPFTVPMIVLKPTYKTSGGVRAKVYPAVKDGFRINGSFRSYGGTETTINGVYTIIDTADVETWYRSDITSDCMIVLADTGAKYGILGEPENINRRNKFLKFKVQRDAGGA